MIPTFPIQAAICESCGHRHGGEEVAYICIGCPCAEEPGPPSPCEPDPADIVDGERRLARAPEVGFTSSGVSNSPLSFARGVVCPNHELHVAASEPCRCVGSICTKHLALAELAMRRPKIVVLCGSTRFADAFAQANVDESMAGHIVLSVCSFKGKLAPDGPIIPDIELEPYEKTKLDELHKRKIDIADEVIVLNVGGYVGQSTASEIEYAELAGKPIRWLEEPR